MSAHIRSKTQSKISISLSNRSLQVHKPDEPYSNLSQKRISMQLSQIRQNSSKRPSTAYSPNIVTRVQSAKPRRRTSEKQQPLHSSSFDLYSAMIRRYIHKDTPPMVKEISVPSPVQ